MTQTINIKFYAGTRAYEIGQTDKYINFAVSPVGLAAMAKVEAGDMLRDDNGIKLGWSSSYKIAAKAGQALQNLVISKYTPGMSNVSVSDDEINTILRTATDTYTIEQTEKKDRIEREKQEQAAKEQAAAEREKKVAEARELLKDEFNALKTELERLEKLRDQFYTEAKKNTDKIRAVIINEIIESGEISRDEEQAVTYKIVREDE